MPFFLSIQQVKCAAFTYNYFDFNLPVIESNRKFLKYRTELLLLV